MILWRYAGPVAAAAAFLSGCYHYRTVNVADVPIGTSIRARLTPNEAARVGEILGTESRSVEGTLIQRGDSGVVLRVVSGASEHPGVAGMTQQHIAISVAQIQELETRALDKGRTSAVLAGGTAALVFIVKGAMAAQKQPEPGPGKGGTDALRAP